MNSAALKLADKALLNFPIITLGAGQVLYHGARSRQAISSMRPNAMFTSSLYYATDYAFIRDQSKTSEDKPDLYRALFCCTLEKDIDIVKITGVDWPALCMEISKADNSMPKYDGWLQQHLTSYIAMRYGSNTEGAKLLSNSNSSLDEYIFRNASSIFSIHRRID